MWPRHDSVTLTHSAATALPTPCGTSLLSVCVRTSAGVSAETSTATANSAGAGGSSMATCDSSIPAAM
eukprot:CAMPEP_0182929180 /NCGR_PEP_ID=MMETSP0105_2-20130417/19987_1 /TAXON_ID=81532 ORGANISM="Acanthoeca-like sp., Strain 10tr" /NCGR_SAMPLE_ID=MMETSP0105_2 /ASSEMBLY_ACC=CAM_ASM_000205 /LENGTH=67 /DNA_ID=CAMNT_0025067295 /DNA_START=27 /DNA_END=230 /DNA_ORIENTATION=-